jgi:hypothetical protein
MATSFSNATIPTKVDIQEPNGNSDLGLEKSRTDALAQEAAPDGGARAWLVAAGGSSIFFACLGFSNAFGAFEEYYLTHQLSGQSPGKISWIGSLSAFLRFAAGMVGGPLFDRFGAKVCYHCHPTNNQTD